MTTTPQTATPETVTPAHAYQAYFGPAIFEPLSELVVGCAAPAPGDRVLDIACGTGILTRRLAALAGPTGRVQGVDINPAMVAVARSIALPPGAPVDYSQGNGTALDVPGSSFEAAYCQQGLQFFPDRAAGVAEMRRAVVPGGRAVVAVWKGPEHHPLYEAMADAEWPHLAEAGLDVTRDDLVAPFSLGDPDELRALLADAGFSRVEVHERSVEARFADADNFIERMEFAYAAVIPRFAEDPAAFQAYLDAISGETRALVAEHRQGDHVVVPMHTHIAVAQG